MTLETVLGWNLSLFHFINATSLPPHLGLWSFIAQDTPYLVAVGMAVWWFFGGRAGRRALMVAVIALAIGMAINFVITSTTYMARPLQAGIGHTWLAHKAETSFPSDHATLLFSIGFALLIAPGLRWVGAAITLIGLVTAWARVFLGVHFPLDMIASGLIALIAAVAANAAGARLDQPIFQPVERLHRRVMASVGRHVTP